MNEAHSRSSIWSHYWSDAPGNKGCLPDAGPGLSNALDGIWADFAATLPEEAAVVDLCCGDGAAGSAMLDARPSLKLQGIDFAELPDEAVTAFPVAAPASIEEMPFDDAAFDAAISQYGIEYVASRAAIAEIVRVVKSGGHLRFLVHSRDSAIFAAGSRRAKILADLNNDRIWDAARAGRAGELQGLFNPIVARWGQNHLVLQIANAIRDSLSSDEEERGAAMDELRAKLAADRTIVAELGRASFDEAGLRLLLSAFGDDANFEDPEPAHNGDDVIGWLVDGRRA